MPKHDAELLVEDMLDALRKIHYQEQEAAEGSEAVPSRQLTMSNASDS